MSMRATSLQAKSAEPFRFGTKAETLASLAPLLTRARLCDQLVITVSEWSMSGAATVEMISRHFPDQMLAVRSSSTHEDGARTSNAGRFESVTNVAPRAEHIADAVERVIASYDADAEGQQVLVQPMVRDVALAGVVLTRDLDTGSPYYVIDYDDFTGRTDTVTGGAVSKMALVHRSNPGALHSPRMRAIIDAVQEIEEVTGSERLDIEFCMSPDLSVTVLQVRPLAAGHRWQGIPDMAINEAIADVRHRVRALQAPVDDLAGVTTILGEMPDWNPAEMIGTTPRRLAVSLYRRLITDRVWAKARAAMGYRNVDRPLMVDFSGRPYIDVRLSLNSFLPAGLDAGLASRIVDIALAQLSAEPQHHDKIEFEIAITCRDLDFETAAVRFAEQGLTTDDIAQWEVALVNLTAKQLAEGRRGIDALLAQTHSLLGPHPVSSGGDALARIHGLLDATERDGTLPFSMLARHAFIGVAFMRSLVARGVLAPEHVEQFMRSIRTVASDVVEAMAAVANGRLPQADFLTSYGHLRPGTYDILSWRYDERPDLYLGHAARDVTHPDPFCLSSTQLRAISQTLKEAGYDLTAEALLDYIAAAIAAREEAKFAFSRGISDSLDAIVKWGVKHDLSRETLSHVFIEDILSAADDTTRLHDISAQGAEAHALARALRFPHLIVEPEDLDVVRPLRGQPTFITNVTVTARAALLTRNEVVDLGGAVVLIESADPGYDWIFSHDIKGLVTEHGGANSHMAIRCAEFGLPAAIGCGERLFRVLSASAVIELNGANRTVRGH